ncbi:MAG: hypothetical protein AAFU03_04390 [Bacteroidota bacterium]
MSKTSILLLIIILLVACQSEYGTKKQLAETKTIDPYAVFEDVKARELIRNAIEYAGGLEAWNGRRSMSYKKQFQLFDASGKVEKSFDQIHRYQLAPFDIKIVSIENGDTIITRQVKHKYSRTRNGVKMAANDEALAKAINTSRYVIGIPFKLLDPGVDIEYLGPDTLYNGRATEVIEVSYNANTHNNHSTSDTWRYYFAVDEPVIVANWVDAGDHFSLIENLSFERVRGILVHQNRKSYRVDSTGQLLYLRAAYQYSDYVIE